MLSPFGDWVRAFRKGKGISLREMARTLNKTPSYLSALELGRKSVPSTITDEILKAYSLLPEELEECSRAVESSKLSEEIRFTNEWNIEDRELAMQFARNFGNFSDEKKLKIRRALEDGDDGTEY